MTALAFSDLIETNYLGEKLKAFVRQKGLSYPRLSRRMEELGVIHQGRPVSIDQIKQWAADAVRLPAWAQTWIVETFSLESDFFSRPDDQILSDIPTDGDKKKNNGVRTENVQGRTLFLAVRLVRIREETMLHDILAQPSTQSIEVPAWLDEAGLYAVRVDTDSWHPYAQRNDAFVVRHDGALRPGRLSLVTRKSDGKCFLVKTIREEGRTLVQGPGLEESTSADEFWNDGLVVAYLPDYIEGRARGYMDEDGLDANHVAKVGSFV